MISTAAVPQDDDQTPGRDSLTAVMASGWPAMTLAKMRDMPDDWQGQMAELIHQYNLQHPHGTRLEQD